MFLKNCDLPDRAFLKRYRDAGDYTDCFAYDLDRSVDLERYITAFYTSAPFRAERLILKVALGRPSSDSDVATLAAGQSQSFAAWTVEHREADQILLCDIHEQTRSWLQVCPNGDRQTRLYFGSAVIKSSKTAGGEKALSGSFAALIGFHRIYSQILLTSAAKRLALS